MKNADLHPHKDHLKIVDQLENKNENVEDYDIEFISSCENFIKEDFKVQYELILNEIRKDYLKEELKEFFKQLNEDKLLIKNKKTLTKDGNYITARKSTMLRGNRRRGIIVDNQLKDDFSINDNNHLKNINAKERKTIFKYNFFSIRKIVSTLGNSKT